MSWAQRNQDDFETMEIFGRFPVCEVGSCLAHTGGLCYTIEILLGLEQ